MRTIKFRAWNKKNKNWSWDDVAVGNGFVGIQTEDNPGFFVSFHNRKDDYEIMQYTGLKDKNGKEIYEGDIVKYYDSTTMWLKAVVKDIGAAFALPTDENPILLNDFTGQYKYDGHSIPEIEVIGNIYEQPELVTSHHETN